MNRVNSEISILRRETFSVERKKAHKQKGEKMCRSEFVFFPVPSFRNGSTIPIAVKFIYFTYLLSA